MKAAEWRTSLPSSVPKQGGIRKERLRVAVEARGFGPSRPTGRKRRYDECAGGVTMAFSDGLIVLLVTLLIALLVGVVIGLVQVVLT
jgi:hypothetical protein